MKYNYDKERQKSGTNKHIPQSKLKIPISYNFFFLSNTQSRPSPNPSINLLKMTIRLCIKLLLKKTPSKSSLKKAFYIKNMKIR
jgi:hypothetical protein